MSAQQHIKGCRTEYRTVCVTLTRYKKPSPSQPNMETRNLQKSSATAGATGTGTVTGTEIGNVSESKPFYVYVFYAYHRRFTRSVVVL